jgi:hypothetical protein
MTEIKENLMYLQTTLKYPKYSSKTLLLYSIFLSVTLESDCYNSSTYILM